MEYKGTELRELINKLLIFLNQLEKEESILKATLTAEYKKLQGTGLPEKEFLAPREKADNLKAVSDMAGVVNSLVINLHYSSIKYVVVLGLLRRLAELASASGRGMPDFLVSAEERVAEIVKISLH
ncbi:MAG: hypothetical protein Q7R92_05310 [bacterium]|nr:hypothetical protein [bacterium]